MKPLAILLAILLVLAPDYAVAGNGNGQGQGQGENNGQGQGQNNANSKSGSGENQDNDGGGAAGSGAGSAASSLVLSPEGQVTIGTDQNIALDAVKAGIALPLVEIERRAIARWGGRIIDARPFKIGTAIIYRLTLMSNDGVSRRVLVDGRNGNPIGTR